MSGRGPCAKQVTRATVVALNGRRFVGENDCANPQTKCARAGMPTGVGYDLCLSVCVQTSHAEVAAVARAGDEARGATIYIEGHYYACGSCMQACKDAGIAEIIFSSPPAMESRA